MINLNQKPKKNKKTSRPHKINILDFNSDQTLLFGKIVLVLLASDRTHV